MLLLASNGVTAHFKHSTLHWKAQTRKDGAGCGAAAPVCRGCRPAARETVCQSTGLRRQQEEGGGGGCQTSRVERDPWATLAWRT